MPKIIWPDVNLPKGCGKCQNGVLVNASSIDGRSLGTANFCSCALGQAQFKGIKNFKE